MNNERLLKMNRPYVPCIVVPKPWYNPIRRRAVLSMPKETPKGLKDYYYVFPGARFAKLKQLHCDLFNRMTHGR